MRWRIRLYNCWELRDQIIRASGKTGIGIEEILRAIIERVQLLKVIRCSIAGIDI